MSTTTRLRRLTSPFKDEGGHAAMLFALALMPIVGFVGAAIDYSRATDFRSKLNQAADAAALIAAKERQLSWDKREKMARDAFDSTLGPHDGLTNVWFKLKEVQNGVHVDAGGDVMNRIMSAVGFSKTAVKTAAEAITITNPTEVALVLDNTGSMKNDMGALRKAARDFTETLFNNAGADQLKMAVVPYVAAVNPGRAKMRMTWMDTGAKSKWHGLHLRDKTIASMIDCNPDPDPKPVVSGGGSGGGGGGGTPGPTDSPPTGKDRTTALENFPTIADLALELFGIKSAWAQVTPATDNPNSGADVNPGTTALGNAYRPGGGTSKVPAGFQYYHPCWLGNPAKVSHFDLFDRISGASWKGCVEARPEPYDVTDDPPSAGNPDTLFVPYFWPDEPGKADGSPVSGAKYNNSYLDDGPLPPGWTYFYDYPANKNENEWQAYANLFKYSKGVKSDIKESPPSTRGPNAACPDEILPLTNKKPDVLNAVQKLSHWEGGGTISSEGLMWGWRVLSPGPPFTEGAPYDPKNKKYLVLMTDGLNSFVTNKPGGPTKSDYTAYGYLRDGRLPSDWFSKGEVYLNNRMRLACQNVKKTGIKVMTILFRETDAATQQLLRDCSSDGKYFYMAANENDLRRAFDEIAGEISRLRLTR